MDKNLKQILEEAKENILAHLKKIVTTNSFDYRTFGTDIEQYISEVLIDVFTGNGLIKSNNDYFLAPDKNYFPDFELKTKTPLALEFKSGNRSKLSKGKWGKCENSNNDMGTLRSWPDKLKKFGGENIYYVFVIYNFNNNIKEVLDVQIKPFYKFIGLNKDGMLKYREKDGNLRPKNFYESSPVKNFEQFVNLFKKTVIYRSKRIIKGHQLIVRKAEEEI